MASPVPTPAVPALPPSKRLLLRSSWQTVNVGDIGHTPGLLQLLARIVPLSQVTLWPTQVDRGVREMLARHFPAVKLVEGTTDAAGRPTTRALTEAFASHDFLLHGSGPALVAQEHLEAWSRQTGKSYGVYGVTIDPLTMPDGRATTGGRLVDLWKAWPELPPGRLAPDLRAVLNGAEFVFCRETMTLAYLRAQGVKPRRLEFAPDAVFGATIRDEVGAAAFRAAHGLEPGRYLCVIPRLRYTPYHLVHETLPTSEDLHRAAISSRHVEADLAKLVEAITAWVTHTGLKVLLCPEMTYQIDVAKQLFDRLPEAIRHAVVWRSTYWLPDEAISTYAQARALLSLDNHSPIFALAQGVPALYARQPTDTTKGQMWADIGLGDWFCEIEEVTGADLAARLLAIHANHGLARQRVAEILQRVGASQRQSLAVLAAVLA